MEELQASSIKLNHANLQWKYTIIVIFYVNKITHVKIQAFSFRKRVKNKKLKEFMKIYGE